MNTAGAARGLRTAIVAILVAAYPFALVTGLDHASPRMIGTLLFGLMLAAVLLSGGNASRLAQLLLRRFGILVVATLGAAATNDPVALKLLPSLTSLWLLATFGATLRREPSIVAQFASAMHDGFPDFLLPYCRKVTLLWCAYFAINALIGAVLAFDAPAEIWAWYTGFLSYLVIAALAVGEYVFHKSRFRYYEDGWADGLWRKLCPPEATALGRRTLAWQLERSGRTPGKTR